MVVDERQVGVAGAQPDARLVRLGLVHRQLDAGVALVEGGHRARRERGAAALEGDQPQAPAAQAGQRGQVLLGATRSGPGSRRRGPPARGPASVRRTPREPRSTSWVPVSRSSAATCWEIADWVKFSASAAAENEPRAATSRRTRMRRTSSISTAYRQAQKSSFGLMAGLCDPRRSMSRRSWLLLGTLSALWGALVPVHQGRARGRRGARR